MKKSLLTLVWRSIVYYRLSVLYQLVVIIILAAIITGSLLTGSSVRESLKTNNKDRIGNTGLVISSGLRFFDLSLENRIAAASGLESVALTEISGWARGFTSGETSLNCSIYGVRDSFFDFHNKASDIHLKSGEAAINKKLAQDLNVNPGDEIVVRFGMMSTIPADSPFSSEDGSFESLILTVSYVLDEEIPSNFSLAINQVRPKNIFVHGDDLKQFFSGADKANRLLIKYQEGYTSDELLKLLTNVLLPSDIGLTLRKSEESAQIEIISDRIFIDQNQVTTIEKAVPGAKPIITYLANSISISDRSTPYSFVSALPPDLYKETPERGSIVINRWLAEDLDLTPGDTLDLSYYISGPLNQLTEESSRFIISGIVDIENIWGDASLMPEFPGISGSESCSRWDAGVPIEMDEIREKDEDYWNLYGGTPKAFINYNEGRDLWGNNFGPATAVRFPVTLSEDEIVESLIGKLNPLENGFILTDARSSSTEAAANSVDFTTLFLSLGFFIIISTIILLSLIISTTFESRKAHIDILRSLGFSSYLIRKILLLETSLIAVLGSLFGVFAGQLFNLGIIKALNSVWRGAVQTDTLSASIDVQTLLTGFFITVGVTFLVLYNRSGRYLRQSLAKKKEQRLRPVKQLKWLFAAMLTVLVLLPLFALAGLAEATPLFFLGGTILFLTSLLFYYLLIIKMGDSRSTNQKKRFSYTWKYYSKYPSRAVTPILFIAAGLFIVISTGANRKSFNSSLLTRDSGTGGYLFWGETATPLSYDLNSAKGRYEYGLTDSSLAELRFIQGRVASGDDASCLNLNQVKVPPLLGIDVGEFSAQDAFSFDSRIKDLDLNNPWDILNMETPDNIIYGVVDQTVLQWSLKLKVGDTIVVATESGEPLNIIIAGGLSASIFQGYIIIASKNFYRYIPSSAGTNIFLVEGDQANAISYRGQLLEAFSQYGVEVVQTIDRLAQFNQVSNTYLTVFMTLGGFGVLLGIIGLAFVLLRNFDLRIKEFALLIATGHSPGQIRNKLFREHLLILLAGVLTGTVPALLATFPSLTSGADIPFALLIVMILVISIAGGLAITISARSLKMNDLVARLRRE